MQRARRTPELDELDPLKLSARREPSKSDPDDPALDWADVPAAVVCAFCGKPDCAGCIAVDDPSNASGVVAIVPWERPGLGWVTRLWATARLATLSHRELFSSLPDGSALQPLEFGVLAELLAAVGVALVFGGVLALIPDFAATALHDSVVRQILLHALGCGIPGLAALMIVLHVLHGVLVDRAASAAGSRRRGRGVRFGLYACGWDLVTLPLGLMVVALTEGLGVAKRAGGLAVSIPVQATRSYLMGVHSLSPEQAKKAAGRANAQTALGALVLLLGIALAIGLACR
jgi:hypothetical protein